jgi:guanine deaminase
MESEAVDQTGKDRCRVDKERNDPMKIALEEAMAGIGRMEGGPFGAVILQGGQVISRAHNEVLITRDPTAHAEIQAIRRAASRLGRFDLSDCVLYTSCEPCPMCLSAVYWARIPRVVFGCTREDAARIGFDDLRIYEVFERSNAACGCEMPGRSRPSDESLAPVEMLQEGRESCLDVFRKWESMENKVQY